jgi:CRP-like cAMP-binding protein
VRTRTARPPELLGLHRPTARVTGARLRLTGVLADCSPTDVRRLVAISDPVVADGGLTVQDLCRSRWVYLLLDGAFAVTCDDTAYVVSAGDAVGVRAALSGRSPIVSIQTLEPSRFLVVPAASLLGLLRTQPTLAFAVARHLADDHGMA